MATYVIGDVQGCFDTLTALLRQIDYRQDRDHLWFVGDLVNRGPRSLDVLRFLRDQGDRVVAVLGNHDLHLLSRYVGASKAKQGDTLEEILAAPDVDELIDWLAKRPLLHTAQDWTMVHAGLKPEWTLADATREARRYEAMLRTQAARTRLFATPAFPPSLRALTTLRTCHDDGTPCRHNGPPETAPAGCLPWFSHPRRKSSGSRIVFGHWAALGVRRGSDYLGLDSGCVWGESLTAFRLDDERLFTEPARERRAKED